MAAQWIKFSNDTPNKPEIFEIAGALDMDPDTVLGKLIRIWIWFDEHTIEGDASSVTFASLSRNLDRLVVTPGFCKACVDAGWMKEVNGYMTLPNFDRHNGETAKKRAQSNRRMAKMRAKPGKKSDAPGVTSASQKASPDEDEEVKKDSSSKSPKKNLKPKVFVPPDLAEVVEYCKQRDKGVDPEQWFDFYTAKDWYIGKNKMKDWKAAVRTWEKGRDRQQTTGSGGAGQTNARSHNQELGDYLEGVIRSEYGKGAI
jgi:hypothetical protein